jgi:hypothetical protein
MYSAMTALPPMEVNNALHRLSGTLTGKTTVEISLG